MTKNWLVPFNGRNESSHSKLNFLYKLKNIYFMDNHRAASWCWEQHTQPNSKINLIHIDAHSDATEISMRNFKMLPDPKLCSIIEYLETEEITHCENRLKVVRWDNYISAFLHSHRKNIDYIMTCTNGSSSIKGLFNDTSQIIIANNNVKSHILPALNSLHKYAQKNSLHNDTPKKTIINIDLDFFSGKCNTNQQPEKYLKDIAEKIGKLITCENICITICISPECCGGWAEAERLLKIFNHHAGINFKLPDNKL